MLPNTIPFINAGDWTAADLVWGFSEQYLRNRFDAPQATPDAHREWWALCLSAHPQVAIAAPRGHAKSTAISFTYVLYELMERREDHVLMLSSNEEIASSFLNEIKVELTENEELIRDYGFVKFLKQATTELIGQFSDGRKFRLIAKGAGQRMRGLKWERKRPGLCVFDDMEDEELVENEKRRDKFRRWFYGTVRPIIRQGGKIRGVGTIIGFDSLLERMMPSQKDADTVVEALRTFSMRPKGWASVKYRAHNPDFTAVLWKEQASADQLRAIRGDYARMGMLDTYGQEYLNDPVDATTAYYRKQDFLPMTDDDRKTRKTYYVGVDLAIGEEDRNAYTVMVVGGLDFAGFLNIVDMRRDRIDSYDIVQELFSIHERWSPEMIRIEEENIAKAVGGFLYREMDERQIYLNIDTAPPTKDKDKRGQSMKARMRAGKVRFDKDADWYADLEDELTKYPKAPFKDIHDAMSWLGLALEEMVNPPTQEEDDEDEYQREVREHLDLGRCITTGY